MHRALIPWVIVVSLAGCGASSPGPADASVALDAGSPADGATSDSGGAPSDAGDLPICPSPSPMAGSPCTAGDGCWIPGTPCHFVYSCAAGAWTPRTVCPPPDAGP